MSDITDDITYEYDVFIIYTGCDHKKAEEICERLQSQKFKCLAQWTYDAFPAGHPVFDKIVENMRKSKTILLVLTKDSFDSTWVCLETVLALEQSVQRGHLALRFVLCDNVQESEISFFKRGLLVGIPDITMSSESWKENLTVSLKKRIDLPDILPVGCLAHGQVFSHFVGYLAHLLPCLEELIEGTDEYKKRPDCVSKKLLMLLPGSCKLPNTLVMEDKGSDIKIEIVQPLERKYTVADKERVLNPPLYKVCKGLEEYFFIADLPNVLNAIFKIKSQGLAEVDIKFQIARFYYTMNEVLNHKQNINCAKKVTLVHFDDSTEHMAGVIFQAVKTDVKTQVGETVKEASHDVKCINEAQESDEDEEDQDKDRQEIRPPKQPAPQMPSLPPPTPLPSEIPRSPLPALPPAPDQDRPDLLIVHGDDKKDSGHANDILNFMTTKKKTVVLQKASFSDLDDARWVVFIISNDSIEHDKCLKLKCESVLINSIDDNRLKTLPVLVDVAPDKMPQMIKWVTLVSVHEPDYLERLLQTMNGGTITVQERLPSGDVSIGLAWAYVLNYLLLTLLGKTDNNLDFKGRIEKLLRTKEVKCGCIPKLFLLVPKSCLAKSDIEVEANKGDLKPIQRVGELTPIKVDKRQYKFHMYKYTNPSSRQSTCFVCEYSTPINCLYQMANHYNFSGLHKIEMQRQAENFVQLFPAIISREAVKKEGDITNMVQLIYFDDEKESLLSAFEREIKFTEDGQTELVFAQQLTKHE